MENQLPTHILSHLLNNEEYCRRVIPYVQKEYFEGSHKTVFELIVKFVGQHNKLPTAKVLQLELKKVNMPDEALTNASALIKEITAKGIKVKEGSYNADDLLSAKSIWLTSSTKGLAQVVEIVNQKTNLEIDHKLFKECNNIFTSNFLS